MNILAIETSSQTCSVALLSKGQIFERNKLVPKKHAEFALPMIDSLLDEADLTLLNIDAIAWGRGPGSFTGVRLGAGIVQGLAFALDCPVIPVSSLAVLAQSAYRQYQTKSVLVAVDARMQEIYCGHYELSADVRMEAALPDRLLKPEELTISIDSASIGVGSAWKEYASNLDERFGEMTVHTELLPGARDLITLATHEHARGRFVSAEKVLPTYLREKVV